MSCKSLFPSMILCLCWYKWNNFGAKKKDN